MARATDSSDETAQRLQRVLAKADELNMRARRTGDLAEQIQLLLGEIVDLEIARDQAREAARELWPFFQEEWNPDEQEWFERYPFLRDASNG